MNKKSSISRRARRGFTLVELLIVIVIIAILAAITVVVYNGVTKKAVDASMRSDLESARNAIAIIKAGHKNYPADASAANNGQGLKASGKNQLTYGSGGPSYCVQVTNPSTSDTFSFLSTSEQIQAGGCDLVSTVAGSQSYTSVQDGTGSGATFDWPASIAVGPDGNLYIGDCGSTIRKMTPSGVVTTIAGIIGTYGYVDGPALSAQISCVEALTVDASGTIYFVQDGGGFYGVRKLSSGTVSTLAGGSTYGYVDGTGTAAQFDSPYGIAIDSSGNLYIGDSDYSSGTSTIRKVTPSGVVTTLAGSSTGFANGTGTAAQFHTPHGIAIDSSDNLYVSDSSNDCIRKVTLAGVVTTFAGACTESGHVDGNSSTARFTDPTGIAIDKNGNLYVTDNTGWIRKITPSGDVSTIAGTGQYGYQDGPGIAAQFSDWMENGIAADASGNLYVVDTDNYLIRKIMQ